MWFKEHREESASWLIELSHSEEEVLHVRTSSCDVFQINQMLYEHTIVATMDSRPSYAGRIRMSSSGSGRPPIHPSLISQEQRNNCPFMNPSSNRTPEPSQTTPTPTPTPTPDSSSVPPPQESEEQAQTGEKRARAWQHFHQINKNGKLRAQCNYCDKSYACESGKNGTSGMNKHMTVCKKHPDNVIDSTIGSHTIHRFCRSVTGVEGQEDYREVSSLWKFDQEAVRKAINVFLIVDEHPFRTVEKEGFRGISHVFTITVDNAFSNDTSVACLRNRDGLKDASESVDRVRNAVRYIKQSTARLAKFEAFQIEEKVEKLRADFRVIRTYGKTGYPTRADWVVVEKMVKILQHFYDLTIQISGSLYVTSNTFLDEISDVDDLIKEWMNSDDIELRDIAGRMKAKFDKYWGDNDKMNMILYVAVMLDHHNKFDYGCEKAIAKNVVRDRDECQNELERYLNAQIVADSPQFDILAWWKMHTPVYPVLSALARHVFAMPISTVATETAFSTGGRVISSLWLNMHLIPCWIKLLQVGVVEVEEMENDPQDVL
ncbi:hypothetical protein RD792_006045, partial [Penstemon davidsonii]